MSVEVPSSNSEKKDAPPQDILGIKVGDIVELGGKKVRVQGFGSKESGFAFMTRDLTPEERLFKIIQQNESEKKDNTA